MNAPAVRKACPVVLRWQDGRVDILVFEHPLAGVQLVKGGIERGETPAIAALRELGEESGIADAVVLRDLGEADLPAFDQVWSLILCARPGLPDTWVHRTADDGGHDFRFYWHPLAAAPSDNWHPLFQCTLAIIRTKLDRPHSHTQIV